MLFFMTPIGEFILLVIVLSIMILLLRLIFSIIEKLILKRKVITSHNRTKLFLVAFAFVTIASATVTYYDYHPRNKFYADEWVKHTLFDLPKEYKIQDKYYGSPDIGGDYTTTALFIFNNTDYLNLKQKFLKDTSFHQISWTESPELYKIMKENNINNTNMKIQLWRENSCGRCQIGLLDDENSILLDTFSY